MNRRMIDGMSWRMAEVYGAVVDRLLINLARHFAFIKDGAPVPGSWEYQIRKLAEMDQVTRESEAIILETLGDADYTLQTMLEEVIRDSLKDVSPGLRKAAEKGLTLGGMIPPNIAPRQMQAFTAFYQQSADKLNLVNTVMLESTEDAYRATVADIATKIDATQRILNTASGEVITGTESFNRVLHDSVRQMVNVGLTGFIDHGNHHWSPEAYVAMDTRTTMTNTAREAVWEEAERYGVELYQVSSHDGARPLCYPWQGKVISKNGWTGEVEDGDGNKITVHSESEIESFRYGGGLFGVNCGHYPIPFTPGFSRIRPPKQDAEENKKEYAESQQQRALERKLREERRELAVMKAQGANEDQINAQKMRVKNASKNLDDFCDETGRARQRSREYTPINATFPDGYKQTRWENGIRYEPEKGDSISVPAVPKAVQETLEKQGEITRPENEQEALKGFKRFNVNTRTDAEMLAQVNPNYTKGTREWTYNCQRTVAAQELVYRGYDVTAMPYNPNDAISDVAWRAWKVPQNPWTDPDLFPLGNKKTFNEGIKTVFDQWGDGSRAIVRLKWNTEHGGNGHFVFARRVKDDIIFTDPQNNTILNINEKLEKTTRSTNQMWVMRVDNREISDNISLAVKNRE